MSDAPPPAPQLLSTRARFAALLAQARARGLTLRAPPPEPSSCCGRGCNGCVWEGFYDAATWWEEDALAALASPQATPTTPTAATPARATPAAAAPPCPATGATPPG